MKIQSSHNKTYVLLGALAIFIILLAGFSRSATNGTSANAKVSVDDVRPNVNKQTTLSSLQLTLSEENYKMLEEIKNKALNRGVIDKEDKEYVPAVITFNGKDFKADIRLKGDWTDHLVGEKWSFRVKLKGNKTILGMKKFSIHHPKTRGYLNEWLYHKASKKERLIGLRYDFVEGVIHIKKEDGSGYINKEVGLYALEETFDKRMIENNQRKESIILKFLEDYWWDDIKERIEIGRSAGLKWDNFQSISGPWKYPIVVFSESNVLGDSTMNGYFELSKNLLENFRMGKLPIEKTFDIKQLALQNALLNLLGADHSLHIINIRFYYNPITSKLEPISFDGNSGRKMTEYHHFMFAKEPRDSVYFKELIGALERVSTDQYLNKLLTENEKELDFYATALSTEFDKSQVLTENIRSNQQLLRDELSRLKGIYGSNEKLESETSPREVIEVSKDYKSWKSKGLIVEQANMEFKDSKVVHLSRRDAQNSSYAIVSETSNAFSNIYEVSFIAKKGQNGGHLALRMQGAYPNRADAVFNLNSGTLIGSETKGAFDSASGTIKSMGDGWFECTLIAETNAEKIKIIIGATEKEKDILNWEASSENKSDIYVVL